MCIESERMISRQSYLYQVIWIKYLILMNYIKEEGKEQDERDN